MKKKEVVNFIHDTAVVDSGARIGHLSYVWHFCHVEGSAKIGSGTSLGQNVYVGKNVVIGNGCKIQNGVQIFSGVVIGDNVFIGPNTTFTNVKYPDARIDRHNEFWRTEVREGVSIGANATILPGIILWEDCVIGAGSVVTKDVEERQVVVGNPAKGVDYGRNK